MPPETETAAPAKPAMRSPKTVTLKRSKVVVVYDQDYSTAAAIAAQKAAKKEPNLFVLYLAQAIATFDGAKWTMGDIREKIRGADYLQLSGEILGGASDDEADEDEAEGKPLAH